MAQYTNPNASSSGLRRIWIPVVTILLAAAGVAAAVILPPPQDTEAIRNHLIFSICGLAVIVLFIWLVFLSGAGRAVRLGVLLLVFLLIGGFAAAVDFSETRFTGDVLPIFKFRWEPDHLTELELHRKSLGDGSELGPVVLATKEQPGFPQYLGVNRDGIVNGPALARDWTKEPPKQLWRQPVGEGHAGFAVVGNIAVTIEQRGDQEVVVCYDTMTGKERWTHAYDARFYEAMGGVGPRSTPTIVDEDVFTLGATGVLTRLNVKTGEPAWSINVLNGEAPITWGCSGSPLIYDNMVVVNTGRPVSGTSAKTIAAYNREDGTKLWDAGDKPGSYSSPMLATLDGTRQVLLLDGAGMGGYDAEKGTPLWHSPLANMQVINCSQPIVLDGNRVFASTGYGTGCVMLEIAQKDGKWEAKELWKNKNMRCKFCSPIYHNGYIYGLNEAVLTCIDAKTGKTVWRGDNFGHGQLLLTGDLLVLTEENTGDLILVEANPNEYRPLDRLDAIDNRTWNPHALANGFVYMRNDREMACYDLRAEKGEQ